jgi:uncharacterized membrane protein YvlD (DUF360 family)
VLDWLNAQELTEIPVGILILRLVLASICGQCIAWISLLKTDRVRDEAISMTLVLMCILIAMATQIIGSNIARAFSLVGALSIVRFRTAMTSTQDVAFVLAAVVVGMAIGAGQYWIALLGLVTLAVVSLILRQVFVQTGRIDKSPWLLTVRATLGDEAGWRLILNQSFESVELVGAQTARKGSAIEYEYRVTTRDKADPASALVDLSAQTQLESVSIRKQL